MSHYDCDNCGYGMGISYGSCENCTPAWVRDAKTKYNSQWGDVKKQVGEYFKEERTSLEEREAQMLKELMEGPQQDYDLVCEAGKDWYKNKNKEVM